MKRVALALSLLFVSVARAQQHPNDAPGFAANKVYDVHDVDAVNAFNGNLTVRLPVGPVYRVNALITYQYVLTYNSHCWHFDENQDGTFVARPRKNFNAGLGWKLSFGRLLEPGDPTNNANSANLVYESSDGSEHVFYADLHTSTAPGDAVGYTRDNSYLRMRSITPTERRVDFPDGTTQVFKLLHPTADLVAWQPSTAADAVWRLVQITSALTNSVTVTYTRSAQYDEIWTVADADRISTVYFRPTGLSTMPSVLQEIDVPSFGGATAAYAFASTGTVVLPTPGGASPPVEGVGGEPVVLLTSVTLPPDAAGSRATYSMMDAGAPAYDGYGSPEGSVSALSGVLRKLTLPTQGSIHWDYDTTTFGPKSPAIGRPVVVTQRQTFQPGATTAEGTWQYGRKFGIVTCSSGGHGYSFGRQLTSWVLRPRTSVGGQQDPQYATVSYFSVYDSDADLCPADQWRGAEYGLPFTRYTSRSSSDDDPVALRYLSSQLVQNLVPPVSWNGQGPITSATNTDSTAPTSVASTYVTYELDSDSGQGTDHNARMSSTATVYDTDAGCAGAACYTATNSYNFDGFGHYQQTSTAGNMPGPDTRRTAWTNYATTLDANSDWVLGTWDKECVTRDNSTPRAQITGMPCATFALSTHAQYDRTNGLLLARRTLKNTGSLIDGHDLLATYEYDGRGYTTKEKYFGGDTQSLAGPDFAPSTTPAYEIDYVPTYGAGKLLSRKGAYARPGLTTFQDDLTIVNETYDTNTAFVSGSTDAANVTTAYTYDQRGRLTRASTPGIAPTTYTYTDGVYNGTFTPASVTVKRTSQTAGVVQQQYDYDGLGRLARERRLLPAGESIRETTYTPTGLRAKTSVFETTPTHYTESSGFDAFDRPTTIKAPDGTSTTYEYKGVREVWRHTTIGTIEYPAAPTDQITKETYDALHHLTQSKELDETITTAYEYDVAGHLASVNVAGQQRTFTYDNRALLVSEQHPENGTMRYTYDARGHVTQKNVNDASTPYDLQFSYDSAERPTRVEQRNPNFAPGSIDPDKQAYRTVKEWSYGTTNIDIDRQQGKMITARRYNYTVSPPDPFVEGSDTVRITESFNYKDDAGRLTDRGTELATKWFNNWTVDKTVSQFVTYNDIDQPSAIDYPKCTGCSMPFLQLQPAYAQGLLQSIPGYVSSITYHPSGMVSVLQHANGIPDQQTMNAANGMARPDQLTFGTPGAPAAEYTTCTPPAQPTVSAQPGTSINANQTVTLTAIVSTGSTPFSYQWYSWDAVQGSTLLPGATSNVLSATPARTTRYFVEVSNECRASDSNEVTITVGNACENPTIADSGDQTVASGTSVHISITVTGTAPYTYSWYRRDTTGNTLLTTQTTSETTSSLNTGPLTRTTTYYATVTNSCDTPATSRDIRITVPLFAPANFTATKTGAAQITLAWGPVSGAATYVVQRLTGGSFAEIARVTTTSYVDAGRAAETTYVYRSYAIDANNTSDSRPGNAELATMTTFTAISADMVVDHVHFDELLHGVNCLRAAAGLAGVTWVQILPAGVNPPATDELILAAHLDALRTQTNNALQVLGIAPGAYTDGQLTTVDIKAVHVRELQERAQ